MARKAKGAAQPRLRERNVAMQQREERGCRCLKLRVEPRHARPKVTITLQGEPLSRELKVEVDVEWRSSITCGGDGRGRCQGIVQISFGSSDWKVDGQPRSPSREGFDPGTSSNVDVFGACSDEREQEEDQSRVRYTAIFGAPLARPQVQVQGKLRITWQPVGCDDNVPWTMDLVLDSTKPGTEYIDEDNSDYDGDGRLNRVDRFPWDPTK